MACHEAESIAGVLSAPSPTEFGSPLQVTPVFRSLAEGIPSPKFSESVSNFRILSLLIIYQAIRVVFFYFCN